MAESRKLLTAAEVSTYLGGHVRPSRIEKAYRDGDLVATKIGRSVFFTEADVDAWIRSCRTPPPAKTSGGLTPRSAAYHRNKAVRDGAG